MLGMAQGRSLFKVDLKLINKELIASLSRAWACGHFKARLIINFEAHQSKCLAENTKICSSYCLKNQDFKLKRKLYLRHIQTQHADFFIHTLVILPSNLEIVS